MRSSRSQIFVLVNYGVGFARAIARGVGAWAAANNDWAIKVGAMPHNLDVFKRVLPGRNSGAILFLSNLYQEDVVISDYLCPVVNVSHRIPDSRLPRVLADNHEAGRRAAKHLLDRGFSHFASQLKRSDGFSISRNEGFVEVLAEAGYDCFDLPHMREPLAVQIKRLPKPVGILALDDYCLDSVLDACYVADVGIPEQVAVIGFDNDEDVCLSRTPQVSSVDTRGHIVGFQAAVLLDRLMRGEAPPTKPVIVPCGEVVTRRSTDTVAVADEQVNAAMRYIRDHACNGLTVERLMNCLTVSRKTLEVRFRKALGRTPREEIVRVKLDHARILLRETDWLVPVVAERSGFCDRHAFGRAFRAAFDTTPIAFREQSSNETK